MSIMYPIQFGPTVSISPVAVVVETVFVVVLLKVVEVEVALTVCVST